METKEKAARVMRFLISGVVGTLVYYLAYYLLTEFAGMWYITSAVIAFILDSVITFVFQKLWTFKNRDAEAVPRQASWYLGLRLGLLGLSTGLLYVLVECAHMYYLYAPLVLLVPLTVVSFILTKRVFTK